jgi:NAD(P)-dependent dehydrogenase (short-subunit alcohol dehydrogenase family)
MSKLKDKVAVLTGATTGMALATAKLFVHEGAHVFITGRRQEQLDAAVQEIGRNVTGVRADSADLADLDRLFETVRREKGRIDVLFASAGVGWWAPLAEVTPEHYAQTFDVNVRGTLFTMVKALPLLTDGASVILNGSIAGSKGMDSFSVYSASKAAVRSFARSWTTDLKARKIRVNVISPGPIDTASLAPLPEETRDQLKAAIPLGRLGKSEEIATAALFLASGDSSFVTGAELFVDGGMAQV